MVDGKGTPLACQVSAANVHDVNGLLPTIVACPLGRHGTEEKLPKKLYADRAYDSEGHEAIVQWMGIEPVFAQRGTDTAAGWESTATLLSRRSPRFTKTGGQDPLRETRRHPSRVPYTGLH